MIIATRPAISSTMPRRIRGGLSRSGRRAAAFASAAAFLAGTVGRVTSLAIANLFLGVQQILQLGHELADVAKVAIDRSEAHVGDLVEGAQLVHDEGADLFGAHFTCRLFL